ATSFPGFQQKLTWVRAESGGNRYRMDNPKMEGWLCPAMFRYFDKAPKQLYVRADSLEQGPAPSTSQSTSASGSAATVTGTIHLEKHFGPPNYGENPDTDQIEWAAILRLDQPFTFHSSDGINVAVSEVQLIGFKQVSEGKHLTCKGHLDEASTGHHR